jgi:hypothetical protein
LIEKHVRERKEKAGLSGARRGKEAAALDAAGAMLGSFGLVAFAAVIWWLIDVAALALALALATLVWIAVSVLAWTARRRLRRTRTAQSDGLFPFPLRERSVHLCLDMQRLFSAEGPWPTPWMGRVLPLVAALASHHPENAELFEPVRNLLHRRPVPFYR